MGPSPLPTLLDLSSRFLSPFVVILFVEREGEREREREQWKHRGRGESTWSGELFNSQLDQTINKKKMQDDSSCICDKG